MNQALLACCRNGWWRLFRTPGAAPLLTCLKHGDQSAEWHADVHTMERLIWSVQRHDDVDVFAPVGAGAGLLKSLREGLIRSAFDPFATGEFFSELEGLHVQLFERADQAPTATNPADAPLMVEVREEIVLLTGDEGPFETASVHLPAGDSNCFKSISCTRLLGRISGR